MLPELKAFFEPKSVVLLGASELKGEGAISAALFRPLAYNLSKFPKGKIHLVDLSGKLEGCVKNVNKVPKGRDLAVALLPRELLTKNLPKLLARRVKALILVSGELEQKQREGLESLAKRGKLLLLGPGATMGVINTSNGLVATPERGLVPKRGPIAVISQDGGVAAAMLDWACFHGIGISKFACVGDGLGVDVATLLQYLARDKETKAICLYLERIREGRKLAGAIGEAVKVKPVVVFRGGPEREGLPEAALRQVGALQARGIGELFTAAEGLAKQPPMQGNRVAIITNVAGQARLALRSLAQEGLVLAEPSAETVKKISKRPGVKVTGFLDLGAGGKADLYKFVMERVLSDKTIDGVVVINALKSTLLEPQDIREIVEAAKKSKDKPVVGLAAGGEDYVLAREVLADTKLPVYDQPEKVARTLRMLWHRGKILEKVGPK